MMKQKKICENLANHAREVVTVARQRSVEFGLQVYEKKRYCGGERPDLLLALNEGRSNGGR